MHEQQRLSAHAKLTSKFCSAQGKSSMSAFTFGVDLSNHLHMYSSLHSAFSNQLMQTEEVGLTCGSIST